MVIREIMILFASTVLFITGIGGIIGLVLGRFFPAYYRTIFVSSLTEKPEFDPIAMGVGQGLTQGVSAGVVVGFLMVFLYTWYQIRTQSSK